MLRFKKADGNDYPSVKNTHLKDVAYYRSENIAATDISAEQYISTENILQNYEGVELSNSSASTASVNAFKCGDTLMANIRPYLKKVWQASFNGGCNADVLIITPKVEELNKDYLYHFIAREQFADYVMSGAKGVKMPRGDKKHIMDCPISVPCLEEQQKIADCLSSVDAVIADYEAQVENMQNQKKGVMQKLFSQEVRFKADDGSKYPEWEHELFGASVVIERGGSPRPIDAYITEGEGLNWIKIGDAPKYGNYITQTAQKIRKEGLKKTRQVYPGDLVLSNSMSFGKPYIMAIEGCIHDGWLVIRNVREEYDLVFLCYLLGSEYMLKQYKSFAAGSTVNNLNIDIVSNTKVARPCLEEQQKIAACLTALDDAIEDLQKTVEHWKNIKKGLLQQLFA